MTKCAILGASGHGKVVAELAMLNGYTDIHFYDDALTESKTIGNWPFLGDSPSLLNKIEEYEIVVVAIGDNDARLNKQQTLENAGGSFKPLIHPSAIVSKYSKIGSGTVVMANAVLSPFSSVGEACIINTSSTVDHDCILHDGVHISPGANLAGSVKVLEKAWIGIGAQIKQSINIGECSIVGAGATVVRDVADRSVVVGTPAKSIIIK